MHYITAILQRPALAVALLSCVIGSGLIARTFLGMPATGANPAGSIVEEVYIPPEPVAADTPEESLPITEPAAPITASVIVYVSGAVIAPDVYQLPAAARVKDVVLAAGGFTAEADPDAINLAAPLSDGQHVYVPLQGTTAHPAAAAPVAAGVGATDGRIDLNTAGVAELDTLPGIGPAIAERIVAHRTSNGPFRSVAELQQIKGIGPALLEQITPLVTVGP
ncbi:MAG TPA: ComEA family DNA-binding protein [Roseiflexaceae bacterium]|nr:ComEA family DNA-binding protein [Roseiflexaceae bacterium]HMP39355.1 ComEA family DNA-binding protein [Roseiflexaceae bacterium]